LLPQEFIAIVAGLRVERMSRIVEFRLLRARTQFKIMLCLSDGYKLVVCSVLEKCGRRAEVGMNEGYRWKEKLFSEQGRMLLEKLALAPWASRRRQVLLELLDRLNPTPEELTAGVEREARKRPEVLRLMTHPGVGPLTALAYVPICLAPLARLRAVPEAWRMPKEFQPGQHLASLSSHESSHPAGEVLIGSRIRQD